MNNDLLFTVYPGYIQSHAECTEYERCNVNEILQSEFIKAKNLLYQVGSDCVVYAIEYFEASGERFRVDICRLPMSMNELEQFKDQHSKNSHQISILAVFRKQEDTI